MSDEVDELEEPAAPHRDWSGRRVPPRRRARVAEVWDRVPLAWKALGVVAAIFLAGVTATSYVATKSEAYELRSAYDVDAAAAAADRVSTQEQIRILQASEAALDASIKAIQVDFSSTRDDVRTILNFMLANPPSPRSAKMGPRSP